MPGGRPKTPLAIAKLRGATKTHPERYRRKEPMPAGRVDPPDHLSVPARQTWDAIAPSMIAAKMLTPPDVPLFAELCEAIVVARLSRIRAVQEATGRLSVAPGAASSSGSWSKAMHVVVQLGGRFGMTPADRARLDLGEPERDSSDLLSPHTWSG